MDNLNAQATDNGQAQGATAQATGATAAMPTQPESFNWKERLGPDLGNAPMFQKFTDDSQGLQNAFKSHAELEKLLGHEKVPIPKDEKDEVGWNRLNKALGVPDTATQYGLKDAEIPEAIKGQVLSKDEFAELVHGFKLTPRQAQGLWQAYNEKNMGRYNSYVQEKQKSIANVINTLRSEWGDAFDANVNLGDMVINKFGGTPEANEWLAQALGSHPYGAKFLAQIGKQFSENKIGEFKYQKFSMAPDEAQAEIAKIMADPKHPYLNEKAPVQERNAAIDYVNSLYAVVHKGRQG